MQLDVVPKLYNTSITEIQYIAKKYQSINKGYNNKKNQAGL